MQLSRCSVASVRFATYSSSNYFSVSLIRTDRTTMARRSDWCWSNANLDRCFDVLALISCNRKCCSRWPITLKQVEKIVSTDREHRRKSMFDENEFRSALLNEKRSTIENQWERRTGVETRLFDLIRSRQKTLSWNRTHSRFCTLIIRLFATKTNGLLRNRDGLDRLTRRFLVGDDLVVHQLTNSLHHRL